MTMQSVSGTYFHPVFLYLYELCQVIILLCYTGQGGDSNTIMNGASSNGVDKLAGTNTGYFFILDQRMLIFFGLDVEVDTNHIYIIYITFSTTIFKYGT